MRIDVYSDVSCPWCYVGERRLKAALEADDDSSDVEVVFRPYQLDPGASESPRPLKQHLQEKFGARVDAMLGQVSGTAAAEGLDFQWDAALSANTLNAHRLLWLARNEAPGPVQMDIAERLFQAHFSEGRNVASREELVAIAVSAGMEGARVREFLNGDEGREEVQNEIQQAQQLGIRAVPTFVFDSRYAVQGAQSVDTLLQALGEVRRIAREELSANVDAARSCEDGACTV